ncbi:MAG: type 1 glutamine amidotransferase [Brevundimonas sp.]|nr:type 1 glutamine amidotransferase [Brevundimonas sp.]
MTHVAILKTGAPPPALESHHGDYPAMFRAILGDGVEATTFDFQSGEWPDPDAFDAAIITGSAAGVYEGDPWISDLLDWIRAAKGRLKLVGICFGHQAMAQALGGLVEKSDKGWGVGLHAYEMQSTESWMTPTARTISIPVSHQDQVVVPPPGSRILAGSAFAPNGALAWDDDAISFQCHPEFTPEYAADLTAGRRGRIDGELVDQALASLKQTNDRALVSQWIRNFISS